MHLNELVPSQHAKVGIENVKVLVPHEHLVQIPDINKSTIITYRRKGRALGVLFLIIELYRSNFSYRPDLIHAHSTIAGIVTRIICPLFRIPVIYCPHGWATEREQPLLLKKFIANIEKTLSNLSKRIIAVSDYERQKGIEMGIRPEKIVTIYNGINGSFENNSLTTWDDGRIKMLFVGRLDRQKGIDVLLKAVQQLVEKVCVRIIGASVVSEVQYNFSDYLNVECLGWKSSREVNSHIAASDVVVVPSRWEGFPFVVLEAMRLAKPVIASMAGGIPEAVIDGKTGRLFSIGDSEELRRIILELDKNALKKMGEAGQKRFQQAFTADKMCNGIFEVYERPLKGGTK